MNADGDIHPRDAPRFRCHQQVSPCAPINEGTRGAMTKCCGISEGQWGRIERRPADYDWFGPASSRNAGRFASGCEVESGSA